MIYCFDNNFFEKNSASYEEVMANRIIDVDTSC